MKIGVLSDTHTSNVSPEVIEKLKKLSLDLIIHCGDYTSIHVVHQLQSLGNFCGVAGNMDSIEIRTLLQEKEVLEVEGKRIAVCHGHSLYFIDRLLEKKFPGKKIDIYIHGHTHRLRNEKKNNIHYLNPGRFPSMLILDILMDKEITVKEIRL